MNKALAKKKSSRRSLSQALCLSASAGFTLLELVVSISIFAFMTAFLVSKYGTFNQSVLLTNLAYDTAITIRGAQTYGLDVQGEASTTSTTGLAFTDAYGVHFGMPSSANTSFILFIDVCGDGVYRDYTVIHNCPNGQTLTNETISTYTMRNGFSISAVCAGTSQAGCTAITSSLDIVFKRPNPDAIIIANGTSASPLAYGQVTVKATDNSFRSIVVQSTGQIAVIN